MKKRAVCGSIACLFAVVVWLLSGCVIVIKYKTDNVDVSSDHSPAKVYVNGHLMGMTPVKLKLESEKVYHIEFKKEGFETKKFTITNHVGVGWITLDIVLGLVPVIVDPDTGAWYELNQDNINTILEKQQ
ncbi:MAG: PEGA domain-containing protein [Gammaproteobacteria bacterium]|nr:PEGA domain-containing protein [Gammaproteobacteria bacterium]MDH5715680.1 PEGA domain-containing protein [Candidatus Aminicenantes bacterium]